MEDAHAKKIDDAKQKLALVETSIANVKSKSAAGHVINPGVVSGLYQEKAQLEADIQRLEANPEAAPSASSSQSASSDHTEGADTPLEEEIGIPQRLLVKRHYTLSPAAIEARRQNAKCRKPGNEGNKNAWKTGLHAQDFITGRIKPCLSTCPIFDDCELIKDGASKPGGVCMDKAAVIETYSAIMEAIKGAGADKYDDFNSITALMNAEVMHVSRMLAQDIIRDGTVVKREKYDKDGKVHTIEYVSHPSLLSLAKITADLGLTPRELNITPKAIKDDKNTEDANETFGKILGRVGKMIKKPEDQE